MTAPRVSVVIAAYNAVTTLEEAIASVAAQGWRDFELIVIDDGSHDETPTLLERLSHQWLWMSWVRQENTGVAAARQHGIELAQSEFIAFLDADDLWVPRKLAAQMAVFAAHPEVALVYTDMRDFLPNRDMPRTLFQEKPPRAGNILLQLFGGNFIQTSTVAVRKSALRAVGGFNPQHRVNEDVDLFLRLAEHHQFDYVDEVLVRRRLLPGSLMHSNATACLTRDLEIADFWMKRRPDLFPTDSALIRRRLARTYARMGGQYLFERKFSQSRAAYWQAFKSGHRDPASALRVLAAHIPPIAYLFWFIKPVLRRILRR